MRDPGITVRFFCEFGAKLSSQQDTRHLHPALTMLWLWFAGSQIAWLCSAHERHGQGHM